MASEEVLRKTLKNADGKPFQKYKGIQNNFVLEDFEIIFDDVQNDRMGHTAIRVRVPLKKAGFPDDTHDTKVREIALRDLIARRFRESARTHARSPIPKTSGGEVFIPRPGQEILERGCIAISPFFIEARFTADLPADGNKVSAIAMDLLLERIRMIISESLYYSSYKQSKLYNHIQTYENAEFIRANLASKGLAAFVADGSVMPRREDDLAPMIDAHPFSCDESLKVTFDLPNGERITGMGVPVGFTVIAGSSRSGKSTLLDAVFSGVYDHIPGDGREYIIASPDAAFIIAEPNRPADSVDISMFVERTPEFEDTGAAKKEFISSPMSELVSISEAVEMGSRLLLMDEEYSNPGVIRKGFLSEGEPIRSMSELGRSMGRQGISVIMVSGDESAIRSADTVLVMDGFSAVKATVDPKDGGEEYRFPLERFPISKGIVYEKGHRDVNVTVQDIRTVEIGEFKVHVPVAALFDTSQTSTVADAVAVMKDMMDGSKSMLETCRMAIDAIRAEDDSFDNGSGMHHAFIRPVDLAAVLNRHPQMLAIQKR
jgi:predicted ABC-class ATPase